MSLKEVKEETNNFFSSNPAFPGHIEVSTSDSESFFPIRPIKPNPIIPSELNKISRERNEFIAGFNSGWSYVNTLEIGICEKGGFHMIPIGYSPRLSLKKSKAFSAGFANGKELAFEELKKIFLSISRFQQ